MKTITKRLLVTSGLFVAFCGLTSFNPFTQAKHLAALEKEGSIDLALSQPGRQHDTNTGTPGLINPSLSNKIKAAEANSTSPSEKPKADPEVKTSAGACVDGKCEEKVEEKKSILAEILEKSNLTDEDKKIIEEQTKGSHRQASDSNSRAPRANLCVGDGTSSFEDYKERALCFKDSKVGLKNKSEDHGLLMEQMSGFVEEITFAGLKPAQAKFLLKQLNRIGDREIKSDIKWAIKSIEIDQKSAAFERKMEIKAQELENIQDPVQRYRLVQELNAEVAGFQHLYRTSVPKANENESSLITTLRDKRAEDYDSLISPVSEAISDKRLVALDMNESFASSNVAGTQSGVSLNGQQNMNGQQTMIGQQGQNGLDPSVARMMTPQQQVMQQQQMGIAGNYNVNSNNMGNYNNGYNTAYTSGFTPNYNNNNMAYNNTNMPMVNGQTPQGVTPYRRY